MMQRSGTQYEPLMSVHALQDLSDLSFKFRRIQLLLNISYLQKLIIYPAYDQCTLDARNVHILFTIKLFYYKKPKVNENS